MPYLPKHYKAFKATYPRLWEAYEQLGILSQKTGPLKEKTKELVKLGLCVGARMEGAVHSHARRALDAGASPIEIRHVVLLGLTTLGFPSTMAALAWVEDVLKRRARRTGRKRR